MPEFNTNANPTEQVGSVASTDDPAPDVATEALLRRERRWAIGYQLSAGTLDVDDLTVLNASAQDVHRASR
jgi:hypothetical protein